MLLTSGFTTGQAINRSHWQANGLVSMWKVLPGLASGPVWYDLAGNYHGALSGPTWSGDKLNFDGVDDYVTVPSYKPLEGGIDELSISLRFSMPVTDNYRTILEKAAVGDYELWIFGFPNTNTVSFYLGGAAVSASYTENRPTYLGFSWSKSSGFGKLYVDGRYIDQLSYSSTFVSDAAYALVFGYMSGFGWPFPGSLDDIRIYNRALSAAEISGLYTDPQAIFNRPSSPILPGNRFAQQQLNTGNFFLNF